MASLSHLHRESGVLPVTDHLSLLCSQYLLSSLCLYQSNYSTTISLIIIKRLKTVDNFRRTGAPMKTSARQLAVLLSAFIVFNSAFTTFTVSSFTFFTSASCSSQLCLHFFFTTIFITTSSQLSLLSVLIALTQHCSQRSLLSSYRCPFKSIPDHIPDHIPDYIPDHIPDHI
ncbi:hypothetical protein FHG87_023760, partial [Trinorchestia longiramus]